MCPSVALTSNCEETGLGYSSLESNGQDQGVNSDVTERLDAKKEEGERGRERELARGTKTEELIWWGEVGWQQAFPYVAFTDM